MARTIWPKVIIADDGEFADWVARGCKTSERTEWMQLYIDELWNTQCGILRCNWQVHHRRAGSVITFKWPTYAAAKDACDQFSFAIAQAAHDERE